MVNQGGEGGVYEEGGYNPNAVYNDGGISDAIAGVGGMIGKVLATRTAGDVNKENIKKSENLGKREAKLNDKKLMNLDNDSTAKRGRIEKRIERVGNRKEKLDTKIEEYSEIDKPTLKSEITSKPSSIVSDKKSSFDIKGIINNSSNNSSIETKPSKMVSFEKRQVDKENKDKLSKLKFFPF